VKGQPCTLGRPRGTPADCRHPIKLTTITITITLTTIILIITTIIIIIMMIIMITIIIKKRFPAHDELGMCRTNCHVRSHRDGPCKRRGCCSGWNPAERKEKKNLCFSAIIAGAS